MCKSGNLLYTLYNKCRYISKCNKFIARDGYMRISGMKGLRLVYSIYSP